VAERTARVGRSIRSVQRFRLKLRVKEEDQQEKEKGCMESGDQAGRVIRRRPWRAW